MTKALGAVARLVRQCHASEARLNALIMAWLLGLGALEALYYYFGKLPSRFYTILPARDTERLPPLLAEIALLVTLVALVSALTLFVGGVYALNLRQTLNSRLQAGYLERFKGYHVVRNACLDSPDQRAAEDVGRFADGWADCVQNLLLTPLLVACYSVECAAFMRVWGVAAIYAYFVVGALCVRPLMQRLVHTTMALNRAEGMHRRTHMLVRDRAEAIAMTEGEAAHARLLATDFAAVFARGKLQLRAETLLLAVRRVFAYVGGVLNYLLLACMLVLRPDAAATTPAAISASSFVALYLIGKLTGLLDASDALSKTAGYAVRVAELLDALQAAVCMSELSQSVSEVCFERVALRTPAGVPLFADFTLRLRPGDHVLIHGASGCGKTSLLRAMAGLWVPSAGFIALPPRRSPKQPRQGVVFLTQTPLLVSGSVYDQLHYPDAAECTSCEQETHVHECLRLAGLEQFASLHRAHTADEWCAILSPGGTQRMMLARVLFHRPIFALLDEATNAIEPGAEQQIYGALWDHGITTVSICHRHGWLEQHCKVILCLRDGAIVVERDQRA